MSDVSVELDQFGATLGQILDDVDHKVKIVCPKAVEAGLKEGAKEWRRNAPKRRGKYKRSIRSHMTNNDPMAPEGEIGSASMPGLPHLLEKGHAKVGGGRVPAIVHIAPAADVAFKLTEKLIVEGIDDAL